MAPPLDRAAEEYANSRWVGDAFVKRQRSYADFLAGAAYQASQLAVPCEVCKGQALSMRVAQERATVHALQAQVDRLQLQAARMREALEAGIERLESQRRRDCVDSGRPHKEGDIYPTATSTQMRSVLRFNDSGSALLKELQALRKVVGLMMKFREALYSYSTGISVLSEEEIQKLDDEVRGALAELDREG